jgi:5-methylthioadenosine/S-adenosylhomocysteine deaminase
MTSPETATNEPTLKIDGARFIITMDPARRIIQDGSVLIRGPRIERVGKTTELAAQPADRVIDAREMVVTPGFVNGHMHISYAHATRGIFPDSLGRAYLPNVFQLQSVMTPEEEYATSLLAVTELLKYGTTCLLDPGSSKHLDACLEAYEQSGCRIIVGTHVTDRPNPLNLPVYATEEAVARMEETIKRYNGRLDGRVRAWAMPFSAEYATPELLRAAKALADRYQAGFTLHHSSTPEATAAAVRQYGKAPVLALGELGCLGPNVVLSHALGLNADEVDALADTDTAVVAVPTAAVKGGAGMTSSGLLPEMLAKGVRAALGTDAANNSNLVETLRAMYLIAVLYKDARRDVQAIPAETALELATIGGANALGLGELTGSLEPGKRADVVLFDTRRPEWGTLFNPVNSLVYSADGRSVHTVIVDGRVVVENQRPLFVDEWELIQRVQGIGASMLERTGLSFAPRWPVV